MKLAMHETQPLVLTGAADCSVRLWNFSGHFVGTFGQVSKELLLLMEDTVMNTCYGVEEELNICKWSLVA